MNAQRPCYICAKYVGDILVKSIPVCKSCGKTYRLEPTPIKPVVIDYPDEVTGDINVDALPF